MSWTALEEDIPPCFFCPISHRPMTSPVCTPSGHTYEREAILSWIQARRGRAFDPKSPGARLTANHLSPNRALKEALEGFLVNLQEVDDDENIKKEATKLLEVLQQSRHLGSEEETPQGRHPTMLEQRAGTSLFIAKEALSGVLLSAGFVVGLAYDAVNVIRGQPSPRTMLGLFIDVLGFRPLAFEGSRPWRIGMLASAWTIRLSVWGPLIAASCCFGTATLHSIYISIRQCIQEMRIHGHNWMIAPSVDVDDFTSRTELLGAFTASTTTITSCIIAFSSIVWEEFQLRNP